VKALRAMIPYRAEDVSPYERPLTDAEIQGFSGGFERLRSRDFSLPFINAAGVLPIPEPALMALYRVDAAILRHAPFLSRYGGVRVFELAKR
jgi:hypothetical protein